MQEHELEHLAAMMAKHFDTYLQAHEKRETTYFETKVTEIVNARFALHETGEHHTFINIEMQREARRQEIWNKVQGSFIFWLLVSATSAAGWAVWQTFFEHKT